MRPRLDEDVDLFDEEFLRRLQRVRLICRRRFQGLDHAERLSRQTGAGMEFADHRNYSRGDDFRALDWKLYGRTGKLFLKLFEEETELPVHFLVDASQSMRAGVPGRRKFDQARRLSAALGSLALDGLDRVGAGFFSDTLHAQIKPSRGRGQFHQLLTFLRNPPKDSGTTHLARAMESFVHGNRRRGLVFVISDFFDPHGWEEGVELLRYHRFEVRLLQVLSEKDWNPAEPGDVELADCETGQILSLTLTPRLLKEYRQRLREQAEQLRKVALRQGGSFHPCAAEEPFDELILNLLGAGGVMR